MQTAMAHAPIYTQFGSVRTQQTRPLLGFTPRTARCLTAARRYHKVSAQNLQEKLKGGLRVAPLQPAFTRRREIFIGRVAMVGFVSAVLGEVLTGRGALSQLGIYTGRSPVTIALLIFGVVSFNYLAAINPRSPTWSYENQVDVSKRDREPPAFQRQVEVYVGRLAMFGFFMSLLGELNTGGRGPLWQLGIRVIANPQTTAYALAVWVGFAAFSAITLSALRNKEDPEY